MSRYSVEFAGSAIQDLKQLSIAAKRQLAKTLSEYCQSGNPLQYADALLNDKTGSYRFRVGHLRVAFDLKGFDIVVLRVRHRRDIYRVPIEVGK